MRILFLCLGNICRSPAAEGVFRDLARKAGLPLDTDSAGTGGWHVGEPPYAPMQKAAQRRGYDLSDLRARQLVREDFTRFDLILAMDRQNLRDAQALAPKSGGAELRLFLPEDLAGGEVPDPYYTRDFDGVLELVETGSARLLAELSR